MSNKRFPKPFVSFKKKEEEEEDWKMALKFEQALIGCWAQ
jgi:hypothetical protein